MIYIVLVVLGLCFGSFVNALVWRLHEQTTTKGKQKKDLSITRGRSMCPDCKHTLFAQDLLPVISWITLRGRCRYCKKTISWQYPIVEVITAVLFILAYAALRVNARSQVLELASLGVFLIAVVIGMALAVYDLKWMLLPDRLIKPFAALGLVYALVNLSLANDIRTAIIKLVITIGISGGIFYVLFQVSDGKWIGGGDVKLGLILGLFLLVPENALIMLFIASTLGCFYALMLGVVGKYKKGIRIPFGPALLSGTYIVVLLGERILTYYQNLILP